MGLSSQVDRKKANYQNRGQDLRRYDFSSRISRY